MAQAKQTEKLSYARQDFEKRIGFPAGRFTQAGAALPIILASLFTVGFYASLIPAKGMWISETFTQRGYVPYLIVYFFFWALMILLIKSRKVKFQRRAAAVEVVPASPDFVLRADSAGPVIETLHAVSDDPSQFLLFNRLLIAVSTLKNMGRVTDIADVLRGQAEIDEAVVESSYTVVRGLIWAIPVLGFIGTVIGLSDAIGSFGSVLSESAEIDALKPALQKVTAGLSTAFETTLQALVAALVLHMLLTMIKRAEEQMLDSFTEYCQNNIVRKLRAAV